MVFGSPCLALGGAAPKKRFSAFRADEAVASSLPKRVPATGKHPCPDPTGHLGSALVRPQKGLYASPSGVPGKGRVLARPPTSKLRGLENFSVLYRQKFFFPFGIHQNVKKKCSPHPPRNVGPQNGHSGGVKFCLRQKRRKKVAAGMPGKFLAPLGWPPQNRKASIGWGGVVTVVVGQGGGSVQEKAVVQWNTKIKN